MNVKKKMIAYKRNSLKYFGTQMKLECNGVYLYCLKEEENTLRQFFRLWNEKNKLAKTCNFCPNIQTLYQRSVSPTGRNLGFLLKLVEDCQGSCVFFGSQPYPHNKSSFEDKTNCSGFFSILTIILWCQPPYYAVFGTFI